MSVLGSSQIVAEIGLDILREKGPSIWESIRTRFTGKTLMIVGPSASGKTSFLNFLKYGMLYEKGAKLPRTRSVANARIYFKVGERQQLELRLKNAYDVPGQWDSCFQADSTTAKQPHAIVVMLDASKPNEAIEWSSGFFTDLIACFGNAGRSARRRLKTIIVVLNKRDLCRQPTLKATSQEIEKLLSQTVFNGLGTRLRENTHVTKCSLVSIPGAKNLSRK